MVYTQSDIRRLVEPVAREFGLRAVYISLARTPVARPRNQAT